MSKALCFFIILTIIITQETKAGTIDCPTGCDAPPVLSEDTEITQHSVVTANSYITDTMTLANHGALDGDIFVGESAAIQFVVRNDGAMGAVFHLSPNSVL